MRSSLVLASLVLLFVAVSAVPAQAQTDPVLDPGPRMMDDAEGGQFDRVVMTTGNLSLRIPLFSYPQRGNLTLSHSLRVTSSVFYPIETCVPQGQGQSCTWKWGAAANPGVVVGDDQQVSGGAHLSGSCKTPAYTFFVTTPDLANHYLYLTSGTARTGCGNTWNYTMETTDGSGFKYVENGLTKYILDRHGIQYSLNSNGEPQRVDSNGNIISPISDTLGRATTGPSATTNLTGCTGALPTSSANLWALPGPAGATTNLKLCYATIPIQTNFNVASVSEYSGTTSNLQCIVLPDGSTWLFEYSSRQPGDPQSVNYGNLTKLTYPTGGSISYTYLMEQLGTATQLSMEERHSLLSTRSVDANDGSGPHTWQYVWTLFTGTGGGSFTSAVATDPLGNDTVYAYGHEVDGLDHITSKQLFNGSQASGTLLVTETTTWSQIGNLAITGFSNKNASVFPTKQVITWASGKTKASQVTYDTGINGAASYGNPLTIKEYDYGTGGSPGPLLRSKSISYLAFANSTYLANNLLNLVSSVVTSDGSGNKCSEVDLSYDALSQLISSGVTMQHQSPIVLRGNLSTITNQLSKTPCASTASWTALNSSTNYFDTGMRATDQDAAGNITSYTYSPTFYGAYVTQITMPNTNSPGLAQHIIKQNFDTNTGLVASYTDQNSNTTSYSYDEMWRVTTAIFPTQTEGTGQTTRIYSNPNTVEVQRKIDGSRNTDSYFVFDGIGRQIRRTSANDEATPWDQVDICYGARGDMTFKSYPYQGSGLTAARVCSGAGDSYSFDVLGRMLQIQHSDGSTIQKSYAGAAVSTLDEGNGTRQIQKIAQSDGLGRMISACEVSNISLSGITGTPGNCGQDISGTGFLTTYGYDALGNLTSVAQGGLAPRSFQYDSFSHLLSSTNPEAGTRTYAYDVNGLLQSTTAPAPNQTNPSTTVTITMTYDTLYRLRTKTYSDGSTPRATYNYDEVAALGVNGLLNTIGRGSSAYVSNSSGQMQAGELASYDSRGNIRSNSQCTPQNCGSGVFNVSYSYDLIHNIITGTNGAGVSLTSSFNRAERLTGLTSSLVDSAHPSILVSGVHYNSFGAELTASLGNNELEGFSYNQRGFLQSLEVGPGAANGQTYSFSLSFAPNGDVLSGIDSVNGAWTYAYDDFNRLTCANLNNGSCATPTSGKATYSYSYDRFGNRWNQTGPYTMDLTFGGTNNHIDGYSYDAAGNLLGDGNHSYKYDAENRIIQVDGGVTATYTYDASGRRIRQMSSAGTSDNVYDFSGRELSQFTSAGAWLRGEVYAAGRHLATYANSNTLFSHSDWLATSRVHTNASGAVTETCSSLPFGDHSNCIGSESSPMHFTDEEHDVDSGLDHFDARYYSGQLARWMIPDWGHAAVPYASLTNPQSLNLYAYVLNNPINSVDPYGHAQSGDEIKGDLGSLGIEGLERDDQDIQQILAAQAKFAVKCGLGCQLNKIFKSIFGGDGPGPDPDKRFNYHPAPPGIEEAAHQANEIAAPLVPKEAEVNVQSGIPGIEFKASTDPESSIDIPEIKDSTNLKKWSSPKLSATVKWNPPPKNESLGEIHAGYIVSPGTNVTPSGPRGLNITVGGKPEFPVGGSLSEEGAKSIWDLFTEGAMKLLPSLMFRF